jgi:hypothetical protein
MPQRTLNTFQGGLNRDIDNLNQPANSMKDSVNGRLIFNADGTYSWENEKGNSVAFNIFGRGGLDSDKYIPIGYAGHNDFVILFSVSAGGAGEIGIFTVDSLGTTTYRTMFNDQDDPNGDSFNFSASNQISARPLYEADQCIRVYWVDGVKPDSNPPRTWTFQYDNAFDRDDVLAYSNVTPSVHSANSQAEFKMGLIKFKTHIGGNLSTGVYQYTYRLVTPDGYKTPWYPLTRKYFMTSDGINSVDWNLYEMEGSGIDSGKGFRFDIKGVDTRYTSIEVAYVYAQDDQVITEANIFVKKEVTGSIMEIDHASNAGEPLEPETIPTIFSVLDKAKDLNIKDKTLYYMNIIEGRIDVNIENVLSGLSVEMQYREIRDDAKGYDDINNSISLMPITNQAARTGITNKRLHAGQLEPYEINSDYTNYKGTQVEHLYAGYWRGETYRFGIVFFDKRGIPGFTYHLADVDFPEQYQDEFEWHRVRADGSVVSSGLIAIGDIAYLTTSHDDPGYPGSPPVGVEVFDGDDVVTDTDDNGDALNFIRAQGVKFSGIDVSTIADQISGFKIVRVKKEGSIIMQGMAMPVVFNKDGADPSPDDSFPMTPPTQDWAGLGSASAASVFYGSAQQETLDNNPWYVRPNQMTIEAPDRRFDSSRVPSIQTQDRIRVVGSVFSRTNPNIGPGTETVSVNQWFLYADHMVQKLYNTNNSRHLDPTDGGPATTVQLPLYGSECSISQDLFLGLGTHEVNYLGTGLDWRNSLNYIGKDNTGHSELFELYEWQTQSWIMLISNFISTTTTVHATSQAPFFQNDNPLNQAGSYETGYLLVNYRRPNNNPYGGQSLSALEFNIFYSTGHFQPVDNNPDFVDPGGFIYDDVEVFGGDCYITFFGYARSVGNYSNGQPNPGPSYADAARGHIFPYESDLNVSLRQAATQVDPMYPHVGTRPQAEFASPGTVPNLSDGLYFNAAPDDRLDEEFNLNEVLLFQELTQFFAVEPFGVKRVTHFPVRVRNSEIKFYGDPQDTWRIFLANNFDDLNGRYGQITGSAFLFNQIYTLQEHAFGRLRAFDRALVETPNLGTLTTGVGPALDGIDYISTDYGCQHQWSITNSDKSIYWVDVNRKKIFRFAQDGIVPLSDIRGLHNYATDLSPFFYEKDNPAFRGGITSTFDYENNAVLFTFKLPGREDFEKHTVSYNEYLDVFMSFHSYIPSFYVSHKGFVFSHDQQLQTTNEFYIHNTGNLGEFYGIVYPSKLEVVVNENPMLHKTFDDIRFNVNSGMNASIDQIDMVTETVSGTLNLVTDTRKKYLEDVFRVPLREEGQAGRVRGKHVSLLFRVDNNLNQLSRATNLVTLYRISNRT